MKRDMMIAFSVHRSSTGSALLFHASRSDAVDRYSIMGTSRLNLMAAMSSAARHSDSSVRRPRWSK